MTQSEPFLQSEEFDGFVTTHDSESAPLRFDFVDEARLGKRAIVVRELLSGEECDRLVSFIDALDRPAASDQPEDIVMTAASATPSHRNNQRVAVSSEKLSKVLFSRLAPLLATLHEDVISCTADNSHTFLNNGFGMKGKWKMHSLNSRFRLCKYHPGGHFGPHFDSDYVVDPMRERSLKTFMVYLNDTYEGGQTNFVESHELHKDEDHGIYCSPEEKIFASLKAKRGDCLLFDHKLLHEGQRVSNGMKYLIRSDLMYINEIGELDEEGKRQEEAMQLYIEGMKLEEKGDVTSAVGFYKRAFKVCPDIEFAYS